VDPGPHEFELLDPDRHYECGSGSGSRRAKMTHKYRKKVKNFHVLKDKDKDKYHELQFSILKI
jgi:hypothetical protein